MIKINLQKKDLKNGDCLEQMRLMPDNSVDSIVTDPPYGISFMGKKWDYQVPSQEVFAEMLRVLKPGAHALIACGTRTQHRMAVNIEDAGFEIRDVITWLYGSGFPKSMDISKAIDKQAGAIRELTKEGVVQRDGYGDDWDTGSSESRPRYDKPATDSAKQWQGWGTALKPACEFWTLARKPLSEKTVASNVLTHGAGGINIDGCRVGDEMTQGGRSGRSGESSFNVSIGEKQPMHQGRWPANLILDEEAARVLDKQSGISKSSGHTRHNSGSSKSVAKGSDSAHEGLGVADSGGASRFFYVAKASKSERDQGCDSLPDAVLARSNSALAGNDGEDAFNKIHEMKNNHPTVKPIKLMQYLVRLITPPGGVCMDPFMGSGSTGVAAIKEGFNFIGIEREPAYFEICKARIEAAV